MKQSKYNYYIPFNKGKTLIFNGYTKKFMVLPNNQSKRFIEILSSPDNISDENLKTNLKHAGFIVENKTIEQIMIVKRRELELN